MFPRARREKGLANSLTATGLLGGHIAVNSAGDAPASFRVCASWPLGHVQRNRENAVKRYKLPAHCRCVRVDSLWRGVDLPRAIFQVYLASLPNPQP